MFSVDRVGADWIVDEVAQMTDEVIHVTPSEYNEEHRYLPESVTSIPGYLRYDVNPFMREIVDCFDIDNDVRECNLMKGVQITYSTALESGVLYLAGHVKTLPLMYMTADKELASARIENNFIPMFNQSGHEDIIRSSDEGNTRKTGKTANHLQFAGGSYLVPFGAKNADKMRSYSICVMLKDEIDAWPETVGKDGDPDKLSDGRCKGYWSRRKIFRGSTPTVEGVSKIKKAYLKGDQRHYKVECLGCGFSQALRWNTVDKETGVVGGFVWSYAESGELDLASVRYCCQKCGHPHAEHDKERLFSAEHGAKWVPTATPSQPGIRSYHLPAFYSPIGMAPWSSLVADYVDCYDVKSRKVTDIGAYQVWYNNVLAQTFKPVGARVKFESVDAHRRPEYSLGDIPNKYATAHCGGPIVILMCSVDVHKSNLAVAVWGFTAGMRCFLIDYWRFEDDDCTQAASPVWQRLRDLIETKRYTADDGKVYPIARTWVDAGYENERVTTFCSDYDVGVYPILGRDRPAKNQTIREFAEFSTKQGTLGYRITVDHYKDRLAPVLRREWHAENGEEQPEHHFNAPVNVMGDQLKELTREYRRKKTDPRGVVSYEWYRPGNAPQELWDLMVYAHAGVEILAWSICIEHFELESINWPQFWQYLEENAVYFENA